jgi:hypothetical protein
MLQLHTERLDLIPLSAVQLQLYLEQPALLEQELGFPISREILTERVQRAIRMKLTRMAHVEEARLAWYTYWLMVIRATPLSEQVWWASKVFPTRTVRLKLVMGLTPNTNDKVIQRKPFNA